MLSCQTPNMLCGHLNAAMHTFEMKQHIALVIFEHLRHELDVHVLDIDLLFTQRVSDSALGRGCTGSEDDRECGGKMRELYLKGLIQDHDGLVELLDVGDDAGEQEGLLVFVR